LREEGILGMFEKSALKEISGPKRDAVTEDWIKLNIEELQNFRLFFTKYYWGNQVE
jgi:hypothetical protein